MSISVILPAYKEAENLALILPKLNQQLCDLKIQYEILVVDTMISMDNTEEICTINNCKYVARQGGNDYGDAICTGIQSANNSRIVVMDADGSHDPKYIKEFWAIASREDIDVIIGSRYIKGGNTHNGFILKSMSHMVNLCYRLIFRIKAYDVSNSFRMYNAEKIKSIELECKNFDIVEEILIRLSVKYENLTLKETPIFFNKRMHGESKRDLFKFILSYITTIIKMYKIKVKAKKTVENVENYTKNT